MGEVWWSAARFATLVECELEMLAECERLHDALDARLADDAPTGWGRDSVYALLTETESFAQFPPRIWWAKTR